jgi:dolichyl-phosphate beta-glucosyltransferase
MALFEELGILVGQLESKPGGATTLSVVVPVYNEAGRLPILFEVLEAEAERQALRAGLDLVEVVVVDDGSTDETPRLIEARTALDARLRLIRFDRNRGKGAAVRAGVLSVGSDRVLVTDVDFSTPMSELTPLASALREGNDVAIGSRDLPASRVVVHQPAHRELMGKTFNILLRLLTGLPFHDTQCGFKLFRLPETRTLFELQRVDGFAFDAELCLTASRLGLPVAEVPVAWVDNRDTKVKLLRSSVRMALDLLRIAWLAHRPLPSPPTRGSSTGLGAIPSGAPGDEREANARQGSATPSAP